MFVCPGVKDEPLGYAMISLGGGLSEMTLCPGREICLWYAAHDLGGTVAFNELEAEVQLPARFRTHPFACPNFQEHTRSQRGGSATRRHRSDTARGSDENRLTVSQ